MREDFNYVHPQSWDMILKQIHYIFLWNIKTFGFLDDITFCVTDEFPVAFYPLTLCSGRLDFSDHDNNGHSYGVEFVDFTDVFDGATQFNGSSLSYFEVGAADVFDTTYHLTIAVHVFASAPGDLVEFSDGGAVLRIVDFGDLALEFMLKERDGINSIVVLQPAFPIDTWTHVAAVYDYDAGEAVVYVNGARSSASSFSSPSTEIQTTGDLIVGQSFAGALHCLSIFDRALDSSEVAGSTVCPLGEYPRHGPISI